MAREHPFLIQPSATEQDTAGAAPAALFDLAVNRAAAAVRGIGTLDTLQAWHARTRFARRVPLDAVRQALEQRPTAGEWHWAGGPSGGWQPGRAPFP